MPTLKDPLDSRWFPELHKITSVIASIAWLPEGLGLEKQRAQFLEKSIRNPYFTYPSLHAEDLERQLHSLARLEEQLFEGEDHPIVREAYRWKLDELRAKINMFIASARDDMDEFQRHSEAVFGAPSPATFRWTVDAIHELVDVAAGHDSPIIQSAALTLRSSLPDIEVTAPIFIPPDKTIQKVFAALQAHAQPLLNIPTTKHWKGEAVHKIFQEALEKVGMSDWEVATETGRYYVSVEHGDSKKIRLPATRTFTRFKLLALLVHEIGVHIVRAENGRQSPLLLLSKGLDRYERGEEGLATLYEEALRGSFQELIRPERYLAFGLTMGLDGTPRDFRDVYEIVYQYFYLRALLAGRTESTAHIRAQRRAWETCLRVFRGTDGQTKGVCFTKDLLYQDGNISLWHALHHHPEEINRLLAGKYDPANPRHRWVLDQLNITTHTTFSK
ncbi:MAG: tyrosine/phenylalanine carboxypeptidase domain-containing protein [Candidatus Andersenbacteria bacterium]